MRQAFAIPIVDEISNTSSEMETEDKDNDNIENNCVEENIDEDTEIQAIESKDLDSLFSL